MASVTQRQAAVDAKLRSLIRSGYRARLERTPPLFGARAIALVHVRGAPAARLAYAGGIGSIPSAPGATDLEDIALQADQILAKVNQIPIDAIGRDIGVIMKRLRMLASSPKMDEGLLHAGDSLAQIDRILKEVQPQIGPLVAKLNQAAAQISEIAASARRLLDGDGAAQDDSLPEAVRQLNEAARSVRTLAEFLERHPDALIRGKRADP